MIRTVMVPLDESALAEQALPLAASIAKQAHARLLLVQVVPLPDEPLSIEDARLSIDEQVANMSSYARQYLRAIRKHLRASLNGADDDHALEIDVQTLVGEPGVALAEHADTAGVDLIVMATHGRSGFSRWALGSIADKVLQLSRVPVIAMRPDSTNMLNFVTPPPLKRILLTLDGSALAETAIPLTTELAQLFNADVNVFRAALLPAGAYTGLDTMQLQASLWPTAEQETNAYLNQVAGGLRDQGLRVQPLSAHNNIVESILTSAEEHNVDLIAMTTHGRTGLGRLVYGSVADRVLRGGHRPVLIIRPAMGG
jgi:nucleotide-binding universal stress UspA family protein